MIGFTSPNKGRALQIYSGSFVFIDGSLLTQEFAVTLEKKNNAEPKYTLAKGFAGMSQGAAVVEVTIENAVPSADFEFSPDFFIRTNAAVEIGVVMASRQTIFKGFITDATYSHSVNDASKLSMRLLCRFEEFE